MHRPTILIVDDDAETQALLRDALLKEEYGVDTAADGKIALDMVTRHSTVSAFLGSYVLAVTTCP
jgi:CheY-like chemotaxis protein